MAGLEQYLAHPPGRISKHEWLRGRLSQYISVELTTGDPIPSERQLAELASVSRMTARRAVDELAAEGIIEREVGRGSFVAPPSIGVPLHLSSFTREMTARGVTPGGRQVSSRIKRADETLAAIMRFPVGTRVWELTRVREADGEPIAVERMNLVASVAPDLHRRDMATESLYSVLESEFGVVPNSAVETVRARVATAEEIELLGLREGSAVLHRTRAASWADDIIEYTVSTYRGDRYMLVGEVELPGGQASPGAPSAFTSARLKGAPL